MDGGFWVFWVVGFGFFGLWNLVKWVVGFGNQPQNLILLKIGLDTFAFSMSVEDTDDLHIYLALAGLDRVALVVWGVFRLRVFVAFSGVPGMTGAGEPGNSFG